MQIVLILVVAFKLAQIMRKAVRAPIARGQIRAPPAVGGFRGSRTGNLRYAIGLPGSGRRDGAPKKGV
jgi:hypothetical protein